MESNKIIGVKIRNIRESKNLTIEEVAERAGVNSEQIERIENDIEIPSLSPLLKIARVLGVRLGTFLDDHTELGPVVNRAKSSKNQNVIRFTSDSAVARKHMEYHSLAQDKTGRHMEPFLVEIEPSEQTDFTLSSHEGEEFLYILEGAVEIIYGKEKHTLEAGDSIYYDSIVAHHVHAVNGRPAKILGVVYMPF